MKFVDSADEMSFRMECRRDDYDPPIYEENSFCLDCGCEPQNFPCGCRCSHENMEVRKVEESEDD